MLCTASSGPARTFNMNAASPSLRGPGSPAAAPAKRGFSRAAPVRRPRTRQSSMPASATAPASHHQARLPAALEGKFGPVGTVSCLKANNDFWQAVTHTVQVLQAVGCNVSDAYNLQKRLLLKQMIGQAKRYVNPTLEPACAAVLQTKLPKANDDDTNAAKLRAALARATRLKQRAVSHPPATLVRTLNTTEDASTDGDEAVVHHIDRSVAHYTVGADGDYDNVGVASSTRSAKKLIIQRGPGESTDADTDTESAAPPAKKGRKGRRGSKEGKGRLGWRALLRKISK